MPEIIILVSAIICVGAGVGLYFLRANPAVLGIEIVSFIALLYGIGQYAARNNIETAGSGVAGVAEKRLGANDAARPDDETQRPKTEAAARDNRAGEARAVPQPLGSADKLDAVAAPQANVPETPAGPVTISNFAARKAAPRYVEISGVLSNKNEFAIKNVVVKCGDKSYASGDVSAVLDNVVPAKSDFQISGLRMGPIRPELPPTVCQIVKFDRAN